MSDKESFERLDDLFYSAFGAEHPAMKDYALIKMKMKKLEDENADLKKYLKHHMELVQEIAALKEYKRFYDHIKAHFEKEHPDWEVMCKICHKTFKEITESGGEVPIPVAEKRISADGSESMTRKGEGTPKPSPGKREAI